jgi:predicted dehydrogenase
VDLYLCGRDADRLRRVARRCGAKDVVIGLERAVTDARFQGLLLALPHDLHCEATVLAVTSGKHVLVEKPIARSLEEADRMIDAARQAGRILMVAEDMHFRPAIREAVRLIAEGAIGEPLYLFALAGGVRRPTGWQASRTRLGGGVMMDLGVHYVRAVRLLVGEPDRTLATRAMQTNTKMEGEDSAEMLLASRRGWRAHLLLSWSTIRGHAPDLMIAGEKGTLQLWPGAPFVDLYPVRLPPAVRTLSMLPSERLGQVLSRPVFRRVRRWIRNEDPLGYLAEIREFLAAVSENRAPVTEAADARRDLEVVLLAYQALEGERWVTIPGRR